MHRCYECNCICAPAVDAHDVAATATPPTIALNDDSGDDEGDDWRSYASSDMDLSDA